MTGSDTIPTIPCTLALFCKRPLPGVGKQRIAAALGEDAALEVAGQLLDCALEDVAAWRGPRALCIAAADDAEWARQFDVGRVDIQVAGNLGQRLQAAYQRLAAETNKVLFIGSDAPTLNRPYLERCAQALETHDVVLGRATDGGVVVMGSRCEWPALEGLPWSTNELGQALANQCIRWGLTVSWQPAHTDIDTADQLPSLATLLRDDPRPARQSLLAWARNFVNDSRYTHQSRAL
ncbi:MAG: DUF2064 domain-containing protein [Pseudomonadota bacterium]